MKHNKEEIFFIYFILVDSNQWRAWKSGVTWSWRSENNHSSVFWNVLKLLEFFTSLNDKPERGINYYNNQEYQWTHKNFWKASTVRNLQSVHLSQLQIYCSTSIEEILLREDTATKKYTHISQWLNKFNGNITIINWLWQR